MEQDSVAGSVLAAGDDAGVGVRLGRGMRVDVTRLLERRGAVHGPGRVVLVAPEGLSQTVEESHSPSSWFEVIRASIGAGGAIGAPNGEIPDPGVSPL
jgi:hypothetical protein